MANDNEIVADCPKKSVDLAKKELRAILGKMNEMRLSIKAWRLLRVHSRLKPTKTMKPMKLRARHLWILLITWITVQVVRNRIPTYRHNKVRKTSHYLIFHISMLHMYTHTHAYAYLL